MPPLRDLTGQQFGRLTVLKQASDRCRSGNVCWLCRCSCNGETVIVVAGRHLVTGVTRSCGCLRCPHGHARQGRESFEHRSWRSMLRRVYGKGHPSYKHYGGRGIAVCDRSRFGEDGKSGFECFLADMGPKPFPKHEIDRWPNRRGNYEPGNCRSATEEDQQNNRTNNILIAVHGETRTIAQWGRELGWPDYRLHRRVRSLRELRTRLMGADAALVRTIMAAVASRGRSLMRDLAKARKDAL